MLKRECFGWEKLGAKIVEKRVFQQRQRGAMELHAFAQFRLSAGLGRLFAKKYQFFYDLIHSLADKDL